MRLIIHIALGLCALLPPPPVTARRYMKCGFIDGKCYAPDRTGSCRGLPLCPSGLKRRFTGYDCCCVLRDRFKVIPSLVQSEKIKIVNDTLASIDACYETVKTIAETHSSIDSESKRRIESLGRTVSDVMREGINRLSMLVDAEFETILKLIFDEEHAHEDEKIGLVLGEAGEIYDRGNEVLERITASTAS